MLSITDKQDGTHSQTDLFSSSRRWTRSNPQVKVAYAWSCASSGLSFCWQLALSRSPNGMSISAHVRCDLKRPAAPECASRTLVQRPPAFRRQPVFDFEAHSCYSAPMETHDSGPTPRRAKSDFLSVGLRIERSWKFQVTQLSTIGATRCELHPIYVKENILCHQKQKSAKHPNNSTQH